jgi:hypothetical protein
MNGEGSGIKEAVKRHATAFSEHLAVRISTVAALLFFTATAAWYACWTYYRVDEACRCVQELKAKDEKHEGELAAHEKRIGKLEWQHEGKAP